MQPVLIMKALWVGRFSKTFRAIHPGDIPECAGEKTFHVTITHIDKPFALFLFPQTNLDRTTIDKNKMLSIK